MILHLYFCWSPVIGKTRPLSAAANEIPESNQLSITLAPSSNDFDLDSRARDPPSSRLESHVKLAKSHLCDRDMRGSIYSNLVAQPPSSDSFDADGIDWGDLDNMLKELMKGGWFWNGSVDGSTVSVKVSNKPSAQSLLNRASTTSMPTVMARLRQSAQGA